MRFFTKRIIVRIHPEHDNKIRYLLTKKIDIKTEDGWEFKYKDVSHLIRCAINKLWEIEENERVDREIKKQSFK
jgi:Arc/MetJ-type ribon-helix-helix transcriptional regulator